ncbi:hypothetical protein [Kitasatospora sp. NBC_01539]|uniref:hypothetical protein n=1 Tax=Kitasatospora sp. NBC_01539 TaxID=2903577 RepID=UPI0038602E31
MEQDLPEQGHEDGRAHYVRPKDAPDAPNPPSAVLSRWERFTGFLSGLMADRNPADLNPPVPHGYDGKRPGPFISNNNQGGGGGGGC